MTESVLTSSALILLLALLRRLLRGKIGPGLQYALWLLVAARLLIPGTLFTAPVSAAGASRGLQAAVQQALPAPVRTGGPSAAHPAVDFEPASPQDGRTSPDWLDLIWKTGMVCVGGALAASNLAFGLRLRKNRRRLPLRSGPWSGKLRVYQAEGIPSPCLFGFLRPAVYFNESAAASEHPEHILTHEYVHYRHGDHLWAVLRSVCLAVHWFNPLVWWAASLSRRDCELACDEASIRRLGEDARIDYGQTLLRMVSASPAPAALFHTATTMTTGKRAMKERIAFIVKRPRIRKMTLVAVMLLACGLAACAFGGEGKAEPAAGPAAAGPGPEDVQPPVLPVETAPVLPVEPAPDIPEAGSAREALEANARSIVGQYQRGVSPGEWLPLMSYMDWRLLAQAAVDAGLDGGDGSVAEVQILDAIERYIDQRGADMTMAEYLYLLSATEGLDGAPSEGYSYMVYLLHAVHPSQFAYVVLEQLPEAQQGAILDFFRYEYRYEMAYYYGDEAGRDGKNWPSREEALHELEFDLAEGLSQQVTEITFHGPGESAQYRFANAYGVGAATFSSENPEVASVDGIGLIVSVAPGETEIYAHYEGAGGPQDFACTVYCDW